MARHPIPHQALDDRLAFVGTSGSGKTYAAGTAVERLLDIGARVVIVDPLDVWYGLRLKKDGRSEAFPVVIFGGARGDLSISEQSGAVIGETVANMAESCIISLGGLGTKAAERRFMLAFLERLYRKAPGEPFHIIFDEADLFAPQKSSEPQLQNLMEQIVRRGRVKGFIPWLITQRPAVLSKDVLSQADGLIAMKLTSSQDRDAIGAWIEGQADRADEKKMLARLPRLKRGEGVVWIPGRDVLTEVAFPEKATFDSSRTPKRGETMRTASLKPVNLDAVKAKLAAVEAQRSPAKTPAAAPSVPSPALDARALREAEDRGRRMGWEEGRPVHYAEGYRDALKHVGAAVASVKPPEGAPIALPTSRPKPVTVATPPAQPSRAVARDESTLAQGERKVLNAIAQYQDRGGIRRETLNVLTGYKKSSRDTYIKKLRARGLIGVEGDRLTVLPEGITALGGDFDPLPTGEALRERALRDLPEGERRVLQAVIDYWPHAIERADLDAATGYKKSSRDTYIKKLRLRQLVILSDGGTVRASDDLFDTAAGAEGGAIR